METIRSRSSEWRAMPLPGPPNVYAARTITGRPPRSSTKARASSTVVTARLLGIGSPIVRIRSANASRFSPATIASRRVPRSSTSYFLRTPVSASSELRFSPVWPPIPLRTPSGRSFAMTFSRNSTVSGSMYTASAISTSVWIVAGFEFTRTVRIPSSRRERHAWDPVPEADPEDGILGGDVPGGLHRGREDLGVGGVARPVRYDHAARLVAGDVLGGRVEGELHDAAVPLGLADDVHLHAAVDDDEGAGVWARVLDRRAGAALRDEVSGFRARHRAATLLRAL